MNINIYYLRVHIHHKNSKRKLMLHKKSMITVLDGLCHHWILHES